MARTEAKPSQEPLRDIHRRRLFYYADYVAPRWSRGVPPIRRIGDHLFFLTAR